MASMSSPSGSVGGRGLRAAMYRSNSKWYFVAWLVVPQIVHGPPAPESTPRKVYAVALCNDDATLDDLREAVETLEETERTGRRVLGSAHPLVGNFELSLRVARAALRLRETPPQNAVDASS